MTELELRRLVASDWAELRTARLAALAEAPDAFASSLAREQEFTEQIWRERAGGGNTVATWDDDAIVGLATGLDQGNGGWHLVGMWVSPSVRGTGVADRLVGAVRDLARESGATSVTLWVTEVNGRARSFYRRLGFVPTGSRQLVRPEEPDHWEEELILQLRGPRLRRGGRSLSALRITSDTVTGGIRERLFTVGAVPGVLWTPAEGSGPRPLVLIGHGGGQHKKEPGVLSRAFPYVRSCGFAAAAIDAPGTGDRPADPEIDRLVAEIQARLAAGQPAGPARPAHSEIVASQLIPDWQATLDALQQLDSVGDSQPVGYYGLSQGGDMGIRLVAAEPRITAAVLGLIGSDWLTGIAARITIPVEFVLQWDDDGHPRDSVMKLFDALGSAEKTLHANRGGHTEVPSFEIDSSIRFFARHLGN